MEAGEAATEEEDGDTEVDRWSADRGGEDAR
jgi:hypothetical protein